MSSSQNDGVAASLFAIYVAPMYHQWNSAKTGLKDENVVTADRNIANSLASQQAITLAG